MKIQGKPYRSIWLAEDGWSIKILDQRQLPWEVVEVTISTPDQAAKAIREMWTRGAPMIAMVGAYGICLGLRADASDTSLEKLYHTLLHTRPTAVNLRWALDQMKTKLQPLAPLLRVEAAYQLAEAICHEDIAINRSIGEHGLEIIRKMAANKNGDPVNILTHCNAGWLATVDYGTATAPMYLAHDAGIPIHIWVDETRPRNQGAFLTAYELTQHGIPHHVITDNAGGHYMQKGKVDMCIVGADRVTANGDVCNKIGTYLKALAAQDNHIPFYVALPYPTIDYTLATGNDIPIEERSEHEVTHLQGWGEQNTLATIQITRSRAGNPGFDITPARLVTGYITDKGTYKHVADIKAMT